MIGQRLEAALNTERVACQLSRARPAEAFIVHSEFFFNRPVRPVNSGIRMSDGTRLLVSHVSDDLTTVSHAKPTGDDFRQRVAVDGLSRATNEPLYRESREIRCPARRGFGCFGLNGASMVDSSNRVAFVNAPLT